MDARGPARRLPLLAAACLLGAALVGCGGDPVAPSQPASPSAAPESVDPFTGVPAARLPLVARVSAYVPLDATAVAVTDWDRVRDRLGLPSLTSRSEAADRARFWREAAAGAVVLAPSPLRDADERLRTDFGFTADDVDWQADVTGPGGSGSVLALRPDLPLDGVRRAVAAGVGSLDGARLDVAGRVLLTGALASSSAGGATWRDDPGLADLLVATARESRSESLLLRRGCVPLDEALGRASGAQAQALAAAHELDELADVEAWSASFGDLVGTVRLGAERTDLLERGDVVAAWPSAGDPSFDEAFAADPVVDPSTGRLGLAVADTAAAAAVVRAGVQPWAVCAEEP